MTWAVEYTDEFERWWLVLDAGEQESVAASVGLIETLGPGLPFPHSSGVESSRHGRMRSYAFSTKAGHIGSCTRSTLGEPRFS